MVPVAKALQVWEENVEVGVRSGKDGNLWTDNTEDGVRYLLKDVYVEVLDPTPRVGSLVRSRYRHGRLAMGGLTLLCT